MNYSSISVVLPAYNEEQIIENTLNSCLLFFRKFFYEFEIIVVDDGSTDKTNEILKLLQSENNELNVVCHQRNLGYGAALRTGLENAKHDYLFFMDSDGQFDISELKKFLPFLSPNNVVIGYRKSRADSIFRDLNAFLYNKYVKLLFGLGVRDIDCAFKLFPKKAYQISAPIKSDGALFSAELLMKIIKKGYELKQIGVSHYPREYGVQSGANIGVIMKMFKESWHLKREVL